MKRLLYLFAWIDGRIWERYRRGRRLEKLILRKMDGDIRLVDEAITQMLTSSRMPIIYRHTHLGNKTTYCLHLPMRIDRE